MASLLEDLCGSIFWDLDLSWNTDNPYLTPCFEQTILSWVPCLFLWIFVPTDVYYAIKSKSHDIPWSPLNIAQLLFSILLILLQLMILIPVVLPPEDSSPGFPVSYISPLLKISTYILSIVLQLYTKRKGVRSSGVQFIFWFLLFLSECIKLRSLISPRYSALTPSELPYVVGIISFGCVLAQFILHSWADVAPLYGPDGSLNISGLKKACPEAKSSYLSRLTFHWYNALAIKGFRKPLEYRDLWELNEEDKSSSIVPLYRKYYVEQELAKKGHASRHLANGVPPRTNSASYTKLDRLETAQVKVKEGRTREELGILSILFKSFGATFMFGASLKIVPDLLLFVSPQILDLLIQFVQDQGIDVTDNYVWKGYFYAFILFVSALLQTLFNVQYSHRMYLIGMRVRTVLVSAVYRKALLVSNAAKRTSTLGEVVNLMSVDVQRIMDNIPFVNMIWSSAFQISLAMYFLWGILGPAVLAGIAIIILLIPGNAILAGKARKLQIIQMKYKDERIKLISEILAGVKVLKLYAWEPSYADQILEIRQHELKVLREQAFLNAGTNFLWTCAPFLIALSTFGTYVVLDERNVLDAQKVFVSMSLLNVINVAVTFLPMIIIFVVQAGVSTKRINKFLNSEEIDPDDVTHDETEDDPLLIEDGTFAWESSPTLQDINLRVKVGSLVAIVGSVGSGKSSLLAALLGEVEKISGRVNTKGVIGYVAQQAWIQNATLRDNIIFGSKFDAIKYGKVIEACALKPDLDILPAGDMTEIGEKGINLSGGQKQRVALARAVYNNSDSYLFDDPLSAVDAHVGKHIFEKVIGPKGYLKRKTRVLVTHGIAFLPQVDQILVMKDGRISEVGTYQQLLDKKGAFADFLVQHLTSEDIKEIEDSEIFEGLANVVPLEQILSKKRHLSQFERQESDLEHNFSDTVPRVRRGRTLSNSSAVSSGEFSRQNSKLSIHQVKDVLIEAEKSETKEVKLTVYIDYFRAAGWSYTFGMVLLYIVYQVFALLSSVWLSKWTEEPAVNGTQDPSVRDLYLGVYGGLGFIQSVAVMGATVLMAIGTLRSAAVLHSKMLSRILRAPMSFFDTTPTGRIVNRFAKDIDTCDNTIPFMIRLWMNSFLQVAATIIIICYTTPTFIIVIIPISVIYYLVQRIYVASSRQLKRIESTSRSPIYSHFGETVSGSTTIRAYRQEQRFIQESEQKVDHNQVSYFPAVTANRWLQVRLETLGNVVILFAAVFAVLARDTLEPGLVGLSISYALQITMALNMLVRWTSDLETNIVSVERVKEYTETVPMEAAWESDVRPPKDWPPTGVVEFVNYQTRYRDGLDLVLRDVSCRIEGGEKIGIVGRTGAGKSSMTLALFRIVEAASGSIIIDGRNISKLGLHDVRRAITIIPQDPVLFSGTLRNNLDPFETETDERIWAALELAHLKTFAKTLPAGLSHEIAEGGDNLSVGQRQLLCLARALLRKSKILVLDEATAAVDLETDDLIQQTIRKEFSDCTVITIAHRLNTIMDSTRVMVLDKGEIREFDTPANLMKNKQTIFFGMAKDAGIAS